jgi:hypothetical protein
MARFAGSRRQIGVIAGIKKAARFLFRAAYVFCVLPYWL